MGIRRPSVSTGSVVRKSMVAELRAKKLPEAKVASFGSRAPAALKNSVKTSPSKTTRKSLAMKVEALRERKFLLH